MKKTSKNMSRHFGSDMPGKLRGTRHKGRNSAVQSRHLSWAGQCKKCVQYDFKFTPVYSDQMYLINIFKQSLLIRSLKIKMHAESRK